MHPEILNKNQTELLNFLKDFKEDFGLVGGTAIALQIGHRQSIDFDLFSFNQFDNFELQKRISDKIKIEKVLIDKLGEYTFLAQGVKITFLHYPFPIQFNEEFEDYLKMPDLRTLAAMKVYQRDYFQVPFLLQNYNFG